MNNVMKYGIVLLCYIPCSVLAVSNDINPSSSFTPQQLQAFENNIITNAEKYFHVNIKNGQIDSFLEEQRLIYYKNLSICKPGVYRYGYIDLFPIFVTATISGFQNDKCIEESVHTPGVTLPDTPGTQSLTIIVKCQFQRDSLKVFTNPISEEMIHDTLKKECQATFNGKPIN